ncbi:hypothetical protein ACT5DV_001501, partial [Vibrio cholerae]
LHITLLIGIREVSIYAKALLSVTWEIVTSGHKTVEHGHDTDPTYRFSQRNCVKSAQRSCAISNGRMTSAMHLSSNLYIHVKSA